LRHFNDFLLSWLRSNAKGELWIMVRDLNQTGTCAGNALIAEGMGTIHYTGNDGFAWYPEGASTRPNDNSWGYIAQGTLTSVTGESMQYSGYWRVVWDPQGGDVHVDNGKVTIH